MNSRIGCGQFSKFIDLAEIYEFMETLGVFPPTAFGNNGLCLSNSVKDKVDTDKE